MNAALNLLKSLKGWATAISPRQVLVHMCVLLAYPLLAMALSMALMIVALTYLIGVLASMKPSGFCAEISKELNAILTTLLKSIATKMSGPQSSA